MSHSPFIYPERGDSFFGNIVRAVASINLESIEAAYHNVRYKVDYHMIHARLKYYSNSKNPRVIHTKLNNQRLLTLRTNPHDPYLVKPGEFLTLGSAGREYNSETLDGFLHYYYHPGSLDIESCPPAICENEEFSEFGVDEMPLATENKRDEKASLVGEDYIKARRGEHLLQLGNVNGSSPVLNEGGICDSKPEEQNKNSQKMRMKRTLHKRSSKLAGKEEQGGTQLDSPLDSLLPRYLQSSYSSPVSFAAEVPRNQGIKRYEFMKSATSGNNTASILGQESCYGNYAHYSNLLQVISPVESVSMFRQNSPRFMRSPNFSSDKHTEDKKVWQVVLSDISLSAARLSTGSEGTSREDYESLKGDLTHAKIKEHQDFFAENLKQGKAKFHGNSAEEGSETAKS